MKNKIAVALAFGCLFATFAFGEPNTQIRYEATDLGSGRWQYTYDVYNLDLSQGINDFTIWFSFGSYDSLTIETQNPPAANWNEVVWQPEPLLGDNGGYDALAKNSNISVGQNVYGFTVSLDWLGTGNPGSQFYEIINPDTFHTIDSGFTIPEPATLLLLGLGGIFLRRKKD